MATDDANDRTPTPQAPLAGLRLSWGLLIGPIVLQEPCVAARPGLPWSSARTSGPAGASSPAVSEPPPSNETALAPSQITTLSTALMCLSPTLRVTPWLTSCGPKGWQSVRRVGGSGDLGGRPLMGVRPAGPSWFVVQWRSQYFDKPVGSRPSRMLIGAVRIHWC